MGEKKKKLRSFPGGSVVKNPPTNAVSTPDLVRSQGTMACLRRRPRRAAGHRVGLPGQLPRTRDKAEAGLGLRPRGQSGDCPGWALRGGPGLVLQPLRGQCFGAGQLGAPRGPRKWPSSSGFSSRPLGFRPSGPREAAGPQFLPCALGWIGAPEVSVCPAPTWHPGTPPAGVLACMDRGAPRGLACPHPHGAWAPPPARPHGSGLCSAGQWGT